MHLLIASAPALLANGTGTINLALPGLKTIILMVCCSWIIRHLYQRLEHLSVHLEAGNQVSNWANVWGYPSAEWLNCLCQCSNKYECNHVKGCTVWLNLLHAQHKGCPRSSVAVDGSQLPYAEAGNHREGFWRGWAAPDCVPRCDWGKVKGCIHTNSLNGVRKSF